MKNILVTGGAGYIGSVCCAQLLARGYSVSLSTISPRASLMRYLRERFSTELISVIGKDDESRLIIRSTQPSILPQF